MKDKNLNSINEDNILDNDYFTIDYIGQNISKNTTFKKWYSIQSEKIKIENEFRINSNKNQISEYLIEEDNISSSSNFLFITVCKNCQCYSRHSFNTHSVFAKCFKCEKEYCIGCSIEKHSPDDNNICFIGYFKLIYLRVIFEDVEEKNLDIMLYIFLFFITIIIMPIYLALISCMSYLNIHRNKTFNENEVEINKYFEIYKVIYPIFFSMLYFVYIITFLPFLFIITLIIFSIPLFRKKFLIIYEPIIG
jgi:hypothetical protein